MLKQNIPDLEEPEFGWAQGGILVGLTSDRTRWLYIFNLKCIKKKLQYASHSCDVIPMILLTNWFKWNVQKLLTVSWRSLERGCGKVSFQQE
jgi:hypothetical protein